jgi:hypothetical protein
MMVYNINGVDCSANETIAADFAALQAIMLKRYADYSVIDLLNYAAMVCDIDWLEEALHELADDLDKVLP